MIKNIYNLQKGMKTKISDDNYTFIKNRYFGDKTGGIYLNKPVKTATNNWYKKAKSTINYD